MVKLTDPPKRPTFITLYVSKLGAVFLAFCIILSFGVGGSLYQSTLRRPNPPALTNTSQRISVDPSYTHAFDHLASHCTSKASPISSTEFYKRQTSLARTLHALNASAYIAEPGASAAFYGNISGSHWHLSERPLLLLVSPLVVPGDGAEDIQAKISILTPSFEATRAKMLSIPSASGIEFLEWPEDVSPYEVAASALSPSIQSGGTVFVDGSIRNFIVDGLQNALQAQASSSSSSISVRSAPSEIRQLRERKAPAEIELLKCANEVTLLAIREVHKRMYIGMRESEASHMMATALAAGGLENGGCLTLFGENAALPHGSGTDRVLSKTDFALFDCTGSLHGYWSDVTRTVALPASEIPEEHSHIWNHVHAAQTIAYSVARSGVLTRTVDQAARSFLDVVGYGAYFTHRLGHGIGLEVHEEPYLRGGSNDTISSGHSFSDEPGVYIEGKVGVRLEDCFYINELGIPIFLTAGVGGQATSPLEP